MLHNNLFLNFQEEIEWKGKKITQFPFPVSISGLHLKNTPVARNEHGMGTKWDADFSARSRRVGAVLNCHGMHVLGVHLLVNISSNRYESLECRQSIRFTANR